MKEKDILKSLIEHRCEQLLPFMEKYGNKPKSYIDFKNYLFKLKDKPEERLRLLYMRNVCMKQNCEDVISNIYEKFYQTYFYKLIKENGWPDKIPNEGNILRDCFKNTNLCENEYIQKHALMFFCIVEQELYEKTNIVINIQKGGTTADISPEAGLALGLLFLIFAPIAAPVLGYSLYSNLKQKYKDKSYTEYEPKLLAKLIHIYENYKLNEFKYTNVSHIPFILSTKMFLNNMFKKDKDKHVTIDELKKLLGKIDQNDRLYYLLQKYISEFEKQQKGGKNKINYLFIKYTSTGGGKKLCLSCLNNLDFLKNNTLRGCKIKTNGIPPVIYYHQIRNGFLFCSTKKEEGFEPYIYYNNFILKKETSIQTVCEIQDPFIIFIQKHIMVDFETILILWNAISTLENHLKKIHETLKGHEHNLFYNINIQYENEINVLKTTDDQINISTIENIQSRLDSEIEVMRKNAADTLAQMEAEELLASLKKESEAKAKEVARIKKENEAKAKAEEIARLQTEKEASTRELDRIEKEKETKAIELARLQKENEDKAKEVVRFQETKAKELARIEKDKAKELERLQETKTKELARIEKDKVVSTKLNVNEFETFLKSDDDISFIITLCQKHREIKTIYVTNSSNDRDFRQDMRLYVRNCLKEITYSETPIPFLFSNLNFEDEFSIMKDISKLYISFFSTILLLQSVYCLKLRKEEKTTTLAHKLSKHVSDINDITVFCLQTNANNQLILKLIDHTCDYKLNHIKKEKEHVFIQNNVIYYIKDKFYYLPYVINLNENLTDCSNQFFFNVNNILQKDYKIKIIA